VRLWIAEKPSLGREIAKNLPGSQKSGNGYIECGSGDVVTWCFGHLYEQAPPQAYGDQYERWSFESLPIFPTEWKMVAKSDAKDQISTIQRFLKQAKEVVNAGDPDREGQYLVDNVIQRAGYRGKVTRAWFSAGLDEANMRRALGALKPNDDYRTLFEAAEERSQSDWRQGMTMTRYVTLVARESRPSDYQDVLLSIGRVQTPTLALVVHRDLEIENFKPTDHFTVAATFDHKNGSFKARWKIPEGTPGLDPDNRLLAKPVAEAVAAKVKGQPGVISRYDASNKSENAPLGYSLSELQLDASRKFGFGAQQVLDIAQALYERHKLTSYPRTDCRYLPEDQLAEAPEVLRAVARVYPALAGVIGKADAKRKSPIWNDKKLTAHHAIRPTAAKGDIAALSDAERKVYDLIVRAYVAQFYPPYEFRSIGVAVTCAGEVFEARGIEPKSLGWKVVISPSAERDEDAPEDDTTALPAMAKGDGVKNSAAAVTALVTKPPSRFTEGTLIKAMEEVHKFVTDPKIKARLKENEGIGTSATRANILETLFKRNFLDAKGKTVISTALGRALIQTLEDPQVGLKDLTDPGLTALFEQKLEEIVKGTYTREAFAQEHMKWLRRLMERARHANFPPIPEGLRGTRKGGASKGGSKRFTRGSGSKGGAKKGGNGSWSRPGAKK
jgi:DNA topoisomerase-3